MEIDRSLIGSVGEPFTVEVEKGAIAKFAAAIGDPNPVFHDLEEARAQGYPGIIAPPTFPVSFNPPEEPVWTRDLDRRRILAGEQSFHYERPIVAGDVLTCRTHFIDVQDKEGRSGRMELLLQEVRGRDGDGALVFTHRKTTIYRAAKGRG
ncbi:MaoC family dehydratase N-terminal domain-containing protein [Ferruginivarius sediminum]|uniref:MaoC family dehydratase n=1 Tax=Ferruginivarius sediminum TaxID=2661937 RepID=A0A369TDW1_9PROT|nr:MaoC family dehydratase N-terminal domain-containing protein [Ferruginivarius sediminum]RDD62347.1 MaoC family dehydratase [Ferruginivarius sediminum]